MINAEKRFPTKTAIHFFIMAGFSWVSLLLIFTGSTIILLAEINVMNLGDSVTKISGLVALIGIFSFFLIGVLIEEFASNLPPEDDAQPLVC